MAAGDAELGVGVVEVVGERAGDRNRRSAIRLLRLLGQGGRAAHLAEPWQRPGRAEREGRRQRDARTLRDGDLHRNFFIQIELRARRIAIEQRTDVLIKRPFIFRTNGGISHMLVSTRPCGPSAPAATCRPRWHGSANTASWSSRYGVLTRGRVNRHREWRVVCIASLRLVTAQRGARAAWDNH